MLTSMEAEWSKALFRLTSVRSDCVKHQQRSFWMREYEDWLQYNPASRKTLAQWKDYQCPSKLGSFRLALLFTVALCASSGDGEESQIIDELWEGLTFSLAHSPNVPPHKMSQIEKQLAGTETLSLNKLKFLAGLDDISTRKQDDRVVPALVLGALVEARREKLNKPKEVWLDKLLSYSLKHFCSVHLAQLWLSSPEIGGDVWEKTILQPLLLKLKSHPDSALAVVPSWIQCAASGSLPPPSGEWQTLVMKQVQSTKEENRRLSHSLVQKWAAKSGPPGAIAWAHCYTKVKTTLAPARLDLLKQLSQLAQTDVEGVVDVPKSFGDDLSALVNKESAHKADAWEAIVMWYMVLRSKDVRTNSNGFKRVAESMASACSKLSETASIVLRALTCACQTTALRLEVAEDLWTTSDSWSKALKKTVENATAKKIDPPLYAFYWAVLYYSSDQRKQEKFPAWVNKIINGPSSCLYANPVGANCGVVVHCFALSHAKLGAPLFTQKTPVSETLAKCISNPNQQQRVNSVLLPALGDLLRGKSSETRKAAKLLASALWEQVERICIEAEEAVTARIATRQARDSDSRSSSVTNKRAISWSVTCRAAQMMLRITPDSEKLWVLAHGGSTLRSACRQRKSLVKFARECLVTLEKDDGRASRVLDCDSSSQAIHRAKLSLWTTIGQVSIALPDDEDDNPPKSIQVAEDFIVALRKQLETKLLESLKSVSALTEPEMALFCSKDGVPFVYENPASSAPEKKKRKSEDEEWEDQMRKELASKKKAGAMNQSSQPRALSTEDKQLVEEQRVKRADIRLLLGGLTRVLEGVEQVALSDIEVGNDSLNRLATPVLLVAKIQCPAFQSVPQCRYRAMRILRSLATCVYEVDESFASDMADALLMSTRFLKSAPLSLETVALPSPCTSAAATLQEIGDFGDSLSAGSFAFIFPILRAALTGPRTIQGCETALRILGLHVDLLSGDDYTPAFASHRKELAITVLELLKHDRALAFQSPSSIEVLVGCYRYSDTEDISTVTTGELAPLLDERGALGPHYCRLGSMMAIAEIAAVHPKLVKNNPLAENRVWVNCFDSDEEIRSQARKTWRCVHCETHESALPPPSPLYAVPLVPLLSYRDASIAEAAATAFAHALGQHGGSISRNLESLCKAYIEAYPTKGSAVSTSSTAKSASASQKKKSIATGLPKKKPIKKKTGTPAGIANIGKTSVGTKKKSSAAAKALMKPKAERKLDRDELNSQFRTTSSNADEEKDTPERVAKRLGVLRVLTATTQSASKIQMDDPTLRQLTGFLIAYGIAEIDDRMKNSARNAFRDILASYGGSEGAVEFLLPQLESVLKSGVIDESALGSLPKEKVPRDVPASDRRKEGAVVALGSVALHLKGKDNEGKIDSTIDMLISTLKTPSEDVQASVADALAKLMKKGKTQDRIESIVGSLLLDCLDGDKLAVRRGGAYGLSAAVKGSGIGTLKKLEVINRLEEAFESGTSDNKEGALFAIELLSSRLGLLFEPYVIVLLPSLLKSFSDGSDYVRKAANHTASLVMSKLSAHGVKLVLPSVLDAFQDSAWRTKQASIRMLGSMSHMAPKQLSAALPKIVPQLTEAFADTHPKVKSSAQEALTEISTVIKNPEIKSISATLLSALTNPAEKTQAALEKLIGTEFLHSIDAPSLAMIVPILHRGLRDRGATVKRMGGLIAGNICTMINDPRDFVPYIPTLLPDLQVALLDPIPDVRSTASKALGSLTRSLGDQILPELRPWLVKKLRDVSCSSAERSGAAQGLTEVLVASGSSVVDDAMKSEILPLRSHPDPSTREGVLWMLSFLPPALGHGFAPFIDISLPALVGGLSDESEPVRDVAMRAGRVLIRSHGKAHVDKILPSLEAGLGNEDHRIRVASLSLLGDLLSMIGGTYVVRGDGNTQDDIRRAEKAQAQIALLLGAETRKRVLSELYLARSDSVHSVRQSAIQVWKTVVSVTARTLREILSVLVNRIIEELASGNPERTEVAAQCLGDLVSKLGDSVLPQIIPVLRSTLQSGDEKTKLGVCVGLNEVIKCSTKDQIVKYINFIVKLVQDALSDDNEDVRNMASASFTSLYSIVGGRAFDEVVPSLLVALEDDNTVAKSRALNGLVGILAVRSRELLPYIIPRLVRRPITINHAQALTGIAEVTGGSIHAHFAQIIPAILGDLAATPDAEQQDRVAALRKASGSICGNVNEAGVKNLISEITSKCTSDKAPMRRESCLMFEALVVERAEQQDFYEHLPVILRELLYRLNDEDKSVLEATNKAFIALSKHVPAEELVKHIEFMRNLLASMVSDARRRKGGVGDGEFLLPGFNMRKGLDPLLPIYQRGILYGSPTIREVSASGLGEVLNITASKFLAGPLIVKMTGPLLRIVGDRNPSNVKVAILKTLGLILVKGGPALRAFVPQFQTTFVKALTDPSRQVRVEAISALSLLMPLSTRVDPLIKELVSGSLQKNAATEGAAAVVAVQTATLEALAAVLEKGGKKAKLPATLPSSLDAAKELMRSEDQGIREGAAKVMGVSCSLMGPEIVSEVLGEMLENVEVESNILHGKLCGIRCIFVACSELSEASAKVLPFVLDHTTANSETCRDAAFEALGPVIGRSLDPKAALQQNQKTLMKGIENTRESIHTHVSIAAGLVLGLQMIESGERLDFLGLNMMDAILKIALVGPQRVQFAFNDVLWLALDVSNGEEGLEQYCGLTIFENQKSVRSLHSKVLMKIKSVSTP